MANISDEILDFPHARMLFKDENYNAPEVLKFFEH